MSQKNQTHPVIPAKAGISESQGEDISRLSSRRLLELYDRVADAPDAIEHLRTFVLDLAVRGKLVEQNPEDEPASELLNHFAAGKADLIKSGTIKKPRNLSGGNDLQPPFDIPLTWQWCRVDAVGAIIGGGTPAAGDLENFANSGEGIPWLTPADLGRNKDLYIAGGSRDLSEKGLQSSSATKMPAGTVLFTSRAPIGYVAIAANVISTNQGFKSVVPFVSECSRFIALVMQAFAPEIDSQAPGTTFKEVSGKIVAGVPFPLPPLAEQQRIVAKVDELMALLDRLEATRTKRETTRDRLTTISLARLTAPETTPEDFPTHARFALEALPKLTARPDQIKNMREIILDLAVRGRLVEQNPEDEPASNPLEAINKIKKKLYAERKIPKPKELPPIKEMSLPFQVPAGWEWSMLGQLCYQIADGPHFSPRYVAADSGVPFLSTRNIRPGGFDFSNVKYVSRADHEKFCKRIKPKPNDILYTKGGTTGIAKVNDLNFEFSVWVHVAVLRVEKKMLFPRYVELALNSPHCYAQSQEYTRGISNFDLGLTRMIKITVPIPPLSEQRRIVAKVDTLMALCDRLEAALFAADNTRARLLETMLQEAVSPAPELQPVAMG